MKYLLMNSQGILEEGDNLKNFQKFQDDQQAMGWLSLESPKREELKLLQSLFNLHPLLIKDCRRDNGFPKICVYDDYLLLILQGINYDGISNVVDLSKLVIIIGQNFLITIQYRDIPSLKNTWHDCRKNQENYFTKINGLIHKVINDFIEEMFPLLDTWEDNIISLEERVLIQNKTQVLEELVTLRRNNTKLILSTKRQKEVINQLVKDYLTEVKDEHEVYLKDLTNNIEWVNFNLEVHQHLLDSLFDTYFSMLSIDLNEKSNKTNQLMQKFTIATLIFLPLSFMVGVYGMNFEYIPEIKWHYGYFIFWAFIITLVLLQLIYFKTKKWLD